MLLGGSRTFAKQHFLIHKHVGSSTRAARRFSFWTIAVEVESGRGTGVTICEVAAGRLEFARLGGTRRFFDLIKQVFLSVNLSDQFYPSTWSATRSSRRTRPIEVRSCSTKRLFSTTSFGLDGCWGWGGGVTSLAFDEVPEMVVAVKEYLPNDIAVRKTDGDAPVRGRGSGAPGPASRVWMVGT